MASTLFVLDLSWARD